LMEILDHLLGIVGMLMGGGCIHITIFFWWKSNSTTSCFISAEKLLGLLYRIVYCNWCMIWFHWLIWVNLWRMWLWHCRSILA
jgi:hypothetical protein